MMLASRVIPELSWQFTLGIVIFTTAMVAWTRRRLTRKPLNPRAATRQRAAELKQRNNAEGDIRDLLLELEQAAREITAQLDTRYRKLELVMRDADNRIAELRRLSGTRGSANAATPVSTSRLDIIVGDEDVEPASATVPTSATVSASTRTVAPRGNDFERVCALADQEMAARDIAARVQRSLGEVELMLAMRGAKRVPQTSPRPV